MKDEEIDCSDIPERGDWLSRGVPTRSLLPHPAPTVSLSEWSDFEDVDSLLEPMDPPLL